MKYLQVSEQSYRVPAKTKFSIQFDRIEIATRIQALKTRLKERANQIMLAKREADRDAESELRDRHNELTEQLSLVQGMFKLANNPRRSSVYEEFYTKHGHEAPERP